MENNFRNIVLRWQISKCTIILPCIFRRAIINSEILTFPIFDLQKLSQDNKTELSPFDSDTDGHAH